MQLLIGSHSIPLATRSSFSLCLRANSGVSCAVVCCSEGCAGSNLRPPHWARVHTPVHSGSLSQVTFVPPLASRLSASKCSVELRCSCAGAPAGSRTAKMTSAAPTQVGFFTLLTIFLLAAAVVLRSSVCLVTRIAGLLQILRKCLELLSSRGEARVERRLRGLLGARDEIVVVLPHRRERQRYMRRIVLRELL